MPRAFPSVPLAFHLLGEELGPLLSQDEAALVVVRLCAPVNESAGPWTASVYGHPVYRPCKNLVAGRRGTYPHDSDPCPCPSTDHRRTASDLGVAFVCCAWSAKGSEANVNDVFSPVYSDFFLVKVSYPAAP